MVAPNSQVDARSFLSTHSTWRIPCALPPCFSTPSTITPQAHPQPCAAKHAPSSAARGWRTSPPLCTRCAGRPPSRWGTGGPAAQTGCRARSSWAACGSAAAACGMGVERACVMPRTGQIICHAKSSAKLMIICKETEGWVGCRSGWAGWSWPTGVLRAQLMGPPGFAAGTAARAGAGAAETAAQTRPGAHGPGQPKAVPPSPLLPPQRPRPLPLAPAAARPPDPGSPPPLPPSLLTGSRPGAPPIPTWKICVRDSRSGRPNSTFRSSRPGRMSAGSRVSGRFVAISTCKDTRGARGVACVGVPGGQGRGDAWRPSAISTGGSWWLKVVERRSGLTPPLEQAQTRSLPPSRPHAPLIQDCPAGCTTSAPCPYTVHHPALGPQLPHLEDLPGRPS